LEGVVDRRERNTKAQRHKGKKGKEERKKKGRRKEEASRTSLATDY
jgi:hypothetical protein